MVRQTQDQWFNSKYIGTSFEGGLPLVDFAKVISSYGIKSTEVFLNAELDDSIKSMIEFPDTRACIVHIDPYKRVVPQSKYGRPLEDADPLLQRDLFEKYMLIESLEVSKESN
jgi:acetolactate synthase-1/2/3 large subunit